MRLVAWVFCWIMIASGAWAQYPFGDTHPVYIAGRSPNTYPVQGIDVSRYQGVINWHLVRRAGVKFAYVKATEGSDWVDPLYFRNIRGAHGAGVRVGAYHFYHFCTSPEAQAALFNRVVERSDGWLPPAVDLEWFHQSSCKRRPSADQIYNEVWRFIRMVEARYGQRPVVYTNPSFFREAGLGRMRGIEFWVRSTAANPSHAYPIRRWLFWQYTGTGILPGIRGNVDINVFAGSRSDWAGWLSERSVRGIEGRY